MKFSNQDIQNSPAPSPLSPKSFDFFYFDQPRRSNSSFCEVEKYLYSSFFCLVNFRSYNSGSDSGSDSAESQNHEFGRPLVEINGNGNVPLSNVNNGNGKR